MKPTLWEKFCIVLCALLLLTLSVAAVFLATDTIITRSGLDQFLQLMSGYWVNVVLWILGALILFVLGISSLFSVFPKSEKTRYAPVRTTASGGITISMDTVEQIVACTLGQNTDVQYYKIDVQIVPDGLEIKLRLALRLDARMHEVTAAIQDEIVQNVATTTSLMVKEVPITIDNSRRKETAVRS